MDLNEKELILKAKAGDTEAFGKLVASHQAKMRAFVSRYVTDINDVSDIVQDAFVEAYHNINQFDEERPFGPWIRGVCKFKVLYFFRQRKKQNTIGMQILDEALINYIGENDEEIDDDRDEKIKTMRLCISKLNSDQQELTQIRYGDGVPVKEIALYFKQSATAISMRLMRIRNSLKKCVKKNYNSV